MTTPWKDETIELATAVDVEYVRKVVQETLDELRGTPELRLNRWYRCGEFQYRLTELREDGSHAAEVLLTPRLNYIQVVIDLVEETE